MNISPITPQFGAIRRLVTQPGQEKLLKAALENPKYTEKLEQQIHAQDIQDGEARQGSNPIVGYINVAKHTLAISQDSFSVVKEAFQKASTEMNALMRAGDIDGMLGAQETALEAHLESMGTPVDSLPTIKSSK